MGKELAIEERAGVRWEEASTGHVVLEMKVVVERAMGCGGVTCRDCREPFLDGVCPLRYGRGKG